MPAQAVQPAQSGRFIRVYLAHLGAAGGRRTHVSGIARLARRLLARRSSRSRNPPSTRRWACALPTKALAEIDSVQHTVGEMQKDLSRLKEAVGQRDAQDKEAQSRLAALEERVTTLATPPPPPVAVITIPSAKQKAAEKVAEKAKALAEKRAAEQRATARVVTVVEEPKPAAAGRSRSRSRATQARDGQHSRLAVPPSRSASPR